jgi:N-acetylmuramoyl-L-alanine amidase
VRLFADARTADHIRLHLAPGLRVWIPAIDAEVLGPAQPRNHPLRDLRVRADSAEADVSFALEEPVFSEVEYGARHLVWTVYGVEAPAPAAAPAAGIVGSLARLPSDVGTARLDIALTEEPLGWRTAWEAGRLVLRIRTMRSLRDGFRGLVVGLDAGHPPEGTIGAAGLHEDSMTLAVARAAADRLRALGAKPVLIRDDEAPVSLDERIARAERNDVHVFISIHGNSPGAGRPPQAVLGTAVYWERQNAYPLARALYPEVARALGHPQLALVREDLAVLRPTWYPAVLVEGTGMVIPEREAFLRTQQGIDAYADGIVAGLRNWLSARRGGPR